MTFVTYLLQTITKLIITNDVSPVKPDFSAFTAYLHILRQSQNFLFDALHI